MNDMASEYGIEWYWARHCHGGIPKTRFLMDSHEQIFIDRVGVGVVEKWRSFLASKLMIANSDHDFSKLVSGLWISPTKKLIEELSDRASEVGATVPSEWLSQLIFRAKNHN